MQERLMALAKEREETIVAWRRELHRFPEPGGQEHRTGALVECEARRLGLEVLTVGNTGRITVLDTGKAGPSVLLRADMDALPMAEESGLPFACPTGTEAHTCGHDFHAAMLLTAAKMLKENEAGLEGTVKLMFQPAEETFEGARNMLENGILENPAPDAALAYHVTSGKMPVGIYMYNNTGTMMFSVDGFKITVKGRGSHGAYPHAGIDPINIAVHVYLALEALIAREVDPAKANVLTIGKFNAGNANNIIPETAVLEGTIRSNDKASRELLVRRMQEVAVRTAEVYGGTAEIEMLSGVPPLICDPKLTTEFADMMKNMGIPGAYPYPGISASASEDFASIAEKVPATFMYLSAGFLDDRGAAPAHNPKVMFNEDVCPIGASCYAHCADMWLKNNK